MEGKIMATIKLNIYKKENKNEIEKTYTTETYDLMLGTVEDIMNIIDVDKMNDKTAIAVMVVKGYSQIKPFIKDVFEGVTDEELNRVKVRELIPTFIDICKSIIDSLDLVKSGN